MAAQRCGHAFKRGFPSLQTGLVGDALLCLVLIKGCAVSLRHTCCCDAELRIELAQLLLCVEKQFLVHALGLLGQVRHRCLYHRTYAVAGHLHALTQAGTQRLVHRLCQARVGGVHILVKALLVGYELCVDLFAGLGHLQHHGLKLCDHLGEGLRLLLQGFEGFLALVRE